MNIKKVILLYIMILCIQYLAFKLSEIRESTNRAMVPEFHRLEKKYENDIANLEIRYENQERNLRDEYSLKSQKQLQVRKLDEDQKYDMSCSELIRRTKNQIAEIELEGRRNRERIQYEFEKEIESIEAQTAKRSDKERKKGYDEIIVVQEDIKKRIDEENSKHNQEMSVIRKDHEHKVIISLF